MRWTGVLVAALLVACRAPAAEPLPGMERRPAPAPESATDEACAPYELVLVDDTVWGCAGSTYEACWSIGPDGTFTRHAAEAAPPGPTGAAARPTPGQWVPVTPTVVAMQGDDRHVRFRDAAGGDDLDALPLVLSDRTLLLDFRDAVLVPSDGGGAMLVGCAHLRAQP